MPTLICKKSHEKIGTKQHTLTCTSCGCTFHRICFPKIPNTQWTDFRRRWTCYLCTATSSQDENSFSAPEQESLSTHRQEQENATFTREKIPVPLFPSKCLKIRHLNVNSIQGKFVELYNFLVSNSFLFCAFTESKLTANEESSSFQIPGYHMLRCDRETRGGGGLVLYLSEDTRYLPLDYNIRFPDETQVQCIQVWFPNIRPLIFLTIYNPPRQTNKKHFASCLESLLFHVQREETVYNIRRLEYRSH
jgi:hypothetical protein